MASPVKLLIAQGIIINEVEPATLSADRYINNYAIRAVLAMSGLKLYLYEMVPFDGLNLLSL